jgi:hypothetical protein
MAKELGKDVDGLNGYKASKVLAEQAVRSHFTNSHCVLTIIP